MKTIIAGSRNIQSYSILEKAMDGLSWEVTEIVEGHAKNGVDALARVWAKANGFTLTSFPAAWDDLETEPVKIRKNRYGKEYNVLAGFNRNEDMAVYADALVAVWDGKSKGTKDMIYRATNYKLLTNITLVLENQRIIYGLDNIDIVNHFLAEENQHRSS